MFRGASLVVLIAILATVCGQTTQPPFANETSVSRPPLECETATHEALPLAAPAALRDHLAMVANANDEQILGCVTSRIAATSTSESDCVAQLHRLWRVEFAFLREIAWREAHFDACIDTVLRQWPTSA